MLSLKMFTRIEKNAHGTGTAVAQWGCMQRPTRRPAFSVRRGFTLIEMLVVLALIGIIVLGVVPSVIQTIARQQTRSFAQTSESFLNFGRLRAIRSGRPVHIRFETKINVHGEQRTSLQAFLDVDGDGVETVNPIDPIINQGQLPGPIKLVAPAGEDVIVGFVPVLLGTVSNPELVEIVFNPDGSVRQTGAVRFADTRGNFMELAVGPSRAVGRVIVRKWDPTEAEFFAAGDGPHDWQWQ